MALVIGLTGNIACGKSSVGAILQQLGADYVDADAIVHSLLSPGTPTAAQVVEHFGKEILRSDGVIDRRVLGRKVFRDPAALSDLERILHPAVLEEVRRRIALTQHPTIVIDAIKLIESGLSQEVDSLWVVTCPRDVQIERLTRTRGLPPQDAVDRVEAQGRPEEKTRLADVVIDNSGSREDLEASVSRAHRDTLARIKADGAGRIR